MFARYLAQVGKLSQAGILNAENPPVIEVTPPVTVLYTFCVQGLT